MPPEPLNKESPPHRVSASPRLRPVQKLWNQIILLLATGMGVGHSPVMPGTVGSLWGIPLVWGLQESGLNPMLQGAAAGLLILLGIPICSQAAKLLQKEDPGAIVFDEIAVFPIVFAVVPVNVTTAILGFLWFRLFDVTKLWPVSVFDRWHGGLGIMTDDLVAGVYAALALWLTMQVPGIGIS